MPRAIGPVEEPRHQQDWRLSSAQEARRRSGPPASREDRRQADQTLEETGRLPRRARRRPLQARPLPVLKIEEFVAALVRGRLTGCRRPTSAANSKKVNGLL